MDNGDPRPHGEADTGAIIRRQDEILELLYWLEGEGFTGVTATLQGMVRFLAQAESEVCAALEQLVRRGDVAGAAGGEFRLTAHGRVEAARRFAEEFAPMLSQGHGECNDPACDCHTNPAGAAECHAHRVHGGE